MKRVLIFVVFLLLISMVFALPPPPPSPGGFGSDDTSGSENSEELPSTTDSSQQVNNQVANTDNNDLAERVLVLENKGQSMLVLVSLGLDVILLIAVIYLIFRKPKLPENQQYPAQQNYQQ